MLICKQWEELARRVIKLLREEWGDKFTDEDAVRISDFCWIEIQIPYPFSEDDIMYVAGEFELLYG